MNSGIWEMNMWQLILLGGPMIAPILACSLVALSIAIEKFIFFASIESNITELKRQVFEYIKANKIKEAILLCDAERSPVARIYRAGLTKYGFSREEIKESIELQSLYEIPKLESRLNILITISHMSPLLGLLGTASGMVSCFHVIHIRAASLNSITPGDLAGGIAEALIATIAGLMVAIPSYVVYNYFVSQVNHFVLEMEREGTEIVSFICQFIEAKH